VVLWGVDLKGGMELGPWAPCLDRLTTTPAQAAELLADAVSILNARAARLAAAGQQLWHPSPVEPALVVVIDEYAELSDDAPAAVGHADSTRPARPGRGRHRARGHPAAHSEGHGLWRGPLADGRPGVPAVGKRRDVDLVLGQGMLAAGWHAHALDAPGKFLISAPEHTTPRRARAYLLTDTDVTTLATRHSPTRPSLDGASRAAAESTPAHSADDQQPAIPGPRHSSETLGEPGPADGEDPDTALESLVSGTGAVPGS
jgi:hypothetical protein